MPIALSDSEMTIIFSAAKPLAVQDRDAFLQDVAKHLAALPERGDGIVHRIAAEIQRDFWDPPVGLELNGPPLRKEGTL